MFAASGGVTWSRSFEVPATDGDTTHVGAHSSARIVDGTVYLALDAG